MVVHNTLDQRQKTNIDHAMTCLYNATPSFSCPHASGDLISTCGQGVAPANHLAFLVLWFSDCA